MLVGITVLGLLVGSFLNVVAIRFKDKRNYIKGRSSCPNCGKTLHTGELIPVVSWLIQLGRCRKCKASISLQYPLVELVTALTFVLVYLAIAPNNLIGFLVLALWLYIFSSLIVLSVYDIKWFLLPDKILLPIIVPATGILLINTVHSGSIESLWRPVSAGLLFGGWFYGMAAISNGKWMGGGDIKLAFIMGLLLGIQKTALAMLLAFWGAAMLGILLIALKLKKKNDPIPFGPFLIVGTFIAFIWGEAVISWYSTFSSINLLIP